MSSLIARVTWVGLTLVVSACPPANAAEQQTATNHTTDRSEIKLAVIIVVDQFRADLISRYEPWFGPGGFRRLIDSGAVFPQAYYSYGVTSTAIGHATIGTGRIPRQHGITNNEWFIDPQSERAAKATGDSDVQPVGLDANEKADGYSPRYLIGNTLGDELKLADRRSRVFAVSLKPRGAIMLSGRSADAAYWWDQKTNKFFSSTWYRHPFPAYLAEFNQQRWADCFIGQTWDKILAPEAYAGCYDVPPEWIGYDYNLGRHFPHVLTVPEKQKFGKPYDGIYGSPFGNEVLLEAARRILVNERLGQGPARDLFCVSFSSNDIVGHVYGPNSAEHLDMTVRTDRVLAELLDLLDHQVGLSHCAIALTGDHGVKELPQVADQLRLSGRHLDLHAMAAGLNARLAEQFGTLPDGKSYLLGIEAPWVWLTHDFHNWNRDKQRLVMHAAADWLNHSDGIAAAFTADELEQAPPPRDDTQRWLAWRSYCPGRSGQLYIHETEHCYEGSIEGGTGHGTGHTSDRNVPILLTGPGVRHGRYLQQVDPVDIAPTLAAMLGIMPPDDTAGRVLYEAFNQ